MENHFNTALTNVDSPEDILQEKICMISAQLKLHNDFLYHLHKAFMKWRQTVIDRGTEERRK